MGVYRRYQCTVIDETVYVSCPEAEATCGADDQVPEEFMNRSSTIQQCREASDDDMNFLVVAPEGHLEAWIACCRLLAGDSSMQQKHRSERLSEYTNNEQELNAAALVDSVLGDVSHAKLGRYLKVADYFVDMAMVGALAEHVAWHVLGGEHLIDGTKQERIEALAESSSQVLSTLGPSPAAISVLEACQARVSLHALLEVLPAALHGDVLQATVPSFKNRGHLRLDYARHTVASINSALRVLPSLQSVRKVTVAGCLPEVSQNGAHSTSGSVAGSRISSKALAQGATCKDSLVHALRSGVPDLRLSQLSLSSSSMHKVLHSAGESTTLQALELRHVGDCSGGHLLLHCLGNLTHLRSLTLVGEYGKQTALSAALSRFLGSSLFHSDGLEHPMTAHVTKLRLLTHLHISSRLQCCQVLQLVCTLTGLQALCLDCVDHDEQSPSPQGVSDTLGRLTGLSSLHLGNSEQPWTLKDASGARATIDCKVPVMIGLVRSCSTVAAGLFECITPFPLLQHLSLVIEHSRDLQIWMLQCVPQLKQLCSLTIASSCNVGSTLGAVLGSLPAAECLTRLSVCATFSRATIVREFLTEHVLKLSSLQSLQIQCHCTIQHVPPRFIEESRGVFDGLHGCLPQLTSVALTAAGPSYSRRSAADSKTLEACSCIFSVFLSALQYPGKLEKLSFCFRRTDSRVSDGRLETLCPVFGQASELQQLELSGCRAKTDSMLLFAQCAASLDSVTCLRLHDVVFEAETVSGLCCVLGNFTSLYSLEVVNDVPQNLYHTHEGPVAVSIARWQLLSLFGALSSLVHLRKLKLSGLLLPDGRIGLHEVMYNALKNLEELDMSNCGMSGNFLRQLFVPRLCLKGVRRLNLSYNNITKTGMVALTGALREMMVLHDLNLKYNPIGDEGAELLAELLPHMPALLNVIIDHTTAAGAKALMHALEGDSSDPVHTMQCIQVQHQSARTLEACKHVTAVERWTAKYGYPVEMAGFATLVSCGAVVVCGLGAVLGLVRRLS